jgi:hypothetical protein
MAIPESIKTLRLADVPSLGRLQQRALVIGAVALVAGLAGAFTNVDQFFRSWLIGVLFCLSLALGSLALLMVQHLSGGQWGLVSRRIFEAATRTLPLVAILFVPILFGLPRIFLWARPEVVASDHVLQMKAPYLNVSFFVTRAIIYFAFWLLCVWLLNKWSAGQDRGEGTTKLDSVRFRKVSAPGLLFLVITVTFASVDWVMSVDPHWFSTIFGLLTITGYGLTALAFTIAVLAVVNRDHTASAFLTARHFHDLGKLLLAFVMLWAYLSFSQFLIIWAGNLPEEIPWYIERVRGSWGAVAILLVVGHFALPFTLLLSATLKKRSAVLAKVAIFVVVMRLVDLIWLIAPTFRHAVPGEAGAVHLPIIPIHWMDVVIPVGLLGVWTVLFVRQLRTQLLFPVNDPYFKEVFAHDSH